MKPGLVGTSPETTVPATNKPLTVELTQRPIIVLGAARSGTKILRKVIATHPAVSEIPHDINFVWKYGNYRLPHDELRPQDAKPPIVEFIRNFFAKHQPGIVVEKTVSNPLRVAFVREVLPEARFVHLIRDGRDVTESSMRMWQAPMDVRRVTKKLKMFPARAVGTYARQYLGAYVRARTSRKGSLSSWGPRFAGIDEMVTNEPLAVVCAEQWRRCVDRALEDLASVPEEDVVEVRYEDLVTTPGPTLGRLYERLGLAHDRAAMATAVSAVRGGNIGKWTSLSPEDQKSAFARLEPTLTTAGYS